MLKIELNPNLSISTLKQQFSTTGLLQIPNAFHEDVATAVTNELEKSNWWLQVRDYLGNGDEVAVGAQNVHPYPLGLIDSEKASIDLNNLFFTRYVAEYDGGIGDAPAIIADLYEYMDSEPYLQVMREITNQPKIEKSLMESACYTKNCFLGGHTDGPDTHLLVACIYNLTQNWSPDWGGFLMINKPSGQIFLSPNWNSISLMAIPVLHCVTSVSPGAGATKRYTINGWLADAEGKKRNIPARKADNSNS